MALKTIKQQAATDLAAQYDTGLPGVFSATYTPPDGVPDYITVRLRHGAGVEEDGADTLGTSAACLIRTSEVTTVKTGATLEIGSDTWEIAFAELLPAGVEWLCDISQR